MFALEYLVGARYGMWARGSLRFPTHDLALAYSNSIRAAEHLCGMSRTTRRVIRVP